MAPSLILSPLETLDESATQLLEQAAPKQPSVLASDRGARVIARAIEIMAQGHYGWSWALAKARAQVR
jgi:hypothetical protein